jgi:hypothetical protein
MLCCYLLKGLTNINASEKIKNRVKLSALGTQTASRKEKQTTDNSTTDNSTTDN